MSVPPTCTQRSSLGPFSQADEGGGGLGENGSIKPRREMLTTVVHESFGPTVMHSGGLTVFYGLRAGSSGNDRKNTFDRAVLSAKCLCFIAHVGSVLVNEFDIYAELGSGSEKLSHTKSCSPSPSVSVYHCDRIQAEDEAGSRSDITQTPNPLV